MSGELNRKAKREMAARAQTLVERLGRTNTLQTNGRTDVDPDAIIDAWRDQFPSDDAFEARLDYLGVTRSECREAFAGNIFQEDVELPAWVASVTDIIEYVQSLDVEELLQERKEADTQHDRAFWVVVRAVGRYVEERVLPESAADTLTESAIDEMVSWFERRFYARFVRVLFVEFKRFVAAHDEDLAFADPEEFDDPPRDYYKQFRAYLLGDGFADLCYEYPMFARLLTVQVRQWSQHLREFSCRLEADYDALTATFSDDGQLGAVSSIEPLADDTHKDGRAVMSVSFDSGETVVYKPRSVDAGAEFYRCLDHISTTLPIPDFETPSYVQQDGYGWMEWVEPEDCVDEAAVERYYKRAGALLAVTYLLEFTDCHYENVVAAGEQPLILDAETIFHPYVDADHDPTENASINTVDHTALLSLLLPFESGQQYGPPVEVPVKVAGLGVDASPTDLEVATKPTVQAANTDVMSVEHEQPTVSRSENVPSVDGEGRLPGAYLSEILEGFNEVYEAADDDDAAPDFQTLIEPFESVENRVVYRPTRTYASLLDSLMSHDCLRNGLRFGVEMEELAVPFCTTPASDPLWGMYAAERQALCQLDPPRFASRPDDDRIQAHGGSTGETANQPGLDRSLERISTADRRDRKRQVEVIRGAFGERPAPPRPTEEATWRPVTDSELVEAAVEAYETLRETAIETDSGRYDWGGIAPWFDTERLRVRPADHSLYIGRTGIALLGAGLYQRLGKPEYGRFARKTVTPTVRAIQAEHSVPSLENHGGTTGIGSVAYGLSVVGDLLDDSELQQTAAELASRVTESFVKSDESYDVVAGSAGTILGLLGCADRTGAQAPIDAARQCGDHLLANGDQATEPGMTWETLDSARPLTGFAHGNAGIAYALARLAGATDDSRYRDAALEAIEYETAVYDVTRHNWPDFRDDSGHSFMDQWCHGRSGVGLARLAMGEYVDDRRIEDGLERALTHLPFGEIRRYDHLCCGNAGRAEFLLETTRRTGRHSGEGRRLLGGVLDSVADDYSYRTASGTHAIADPTFFHGSAGIGYTMLRAVDPTTLPAVLIWE